MTPFLVATCHGDRQVAHTCPMCGLSRCDVLLPAWPAVEGEFLCRSCLESKAPAILKVADSLAYRRATGQLGDGELAAALKSQPEGVNDGNR